MPSSAAGNEAGREKTAVEAPAVFWAVPTRWLQHPPGSEGHGLTMLLLPGLVGLLCVVIVVVAALARRGVVGRLDARVPAAETLAILAAAFSVGAGVIHAAAA